ncbi:DNA-binding response regulator [Bifidobacterium tissieri]|uniref:DNA-binding response regulator n=2 Tax=Bifidobacterium tissieri TaxID=1630162 RepID=A0A261F921_9BIFI|nr:DNA-binding response regulator [Bifidobacterium tissieri]
MLACMGNEMSRPQRIRIAIVDNDALSLKFLSMFLQQTNPMIQVLWTCTTGEKAIQQVFEPDAQPDILLVDMSLGDMSGASVCREIRRRTDRVRILGITSFTLDRYAQRFADAGGQGILGKENMRDIALAIGTVLKKETLSDSSIDMTPTITFDDAKTAHQRLRTAQDPFQLLSPTEQRVLELYANGDNMAEVAKKLSISEGTVKTHITRLEKKLGLSSRQQVIVHWWTSKR